MNNWPKPRSCAALHWTWRCPLDLPSHLRTVFIDISCICVPCKNSFSFHAKPYCKVEFRLVYEHLLNGAQAGFLLAGRNSSPEEAMDAKAATDSSARFYGRNWKHFMKKLSGFWYFEMASPSELRHIHFESLTLHHTHTHTHALIDTQAEHFPRR